MKFLRTLDSDIVPRFLFELEFIEIIVQICQRKSNILKEFRFNDFSIYAGSDVFENLLEFLIEKAYSKVFVLTDENVEKHCLPRLNRFLFDINHIRIPSGEQHKTIQSAIQVWDELFRHQADRNAVLINLGGGMIGDLGGFCAATWKRGIDFINIPTTLLSMVDSSVGGKNGVDFHSVKNAIGTFQHPAAIYIQPVFLNTLPHAEIRSGFAEMLKHGLITDAEYWEELIQVNDTDITEVASKINGSVKVKMKIVKKDPLEKNIRRRLNFGHTIGHAIEAYSLKNDRNPLRHGEAIAIGMICESYLSRINHSLSSRELDQITRNIRDRFPKYSLRNILSPELIKLMRQDKKNSHEAFQFTLLRTIGKSDINKVCSETEITAALNYYDGL